MDAGQQCRSQRNTHPLTGSQLNDEFFRHEYGRLVSVLSCRVGVQHLQAIEDAAQAALIKAHQQQLAGTLPDNPSAWLYRVTLNHLLGELRQQTNHSRLLHDNAALLVPDNLHNQPDLQFAEGIQDDILRLLFVCCDDAIPEESQLVLALKTLCGFSVAEISFRLFISEASAYKRLTRARKRLQQYSHYPDSLNPEQLASRRPAVHRILYLLFTEGHLSTHALWSIRRELCDEAVRLCSLLAAYDSNPNPETCALLALMYLHMARMGSRRNASGGLLLLEEQDRSQWDLRLIQTGLEWLHKSSHGERFSRYHAEAGIAAAHCLAPTLADTRWAEIIDCYELLEQISPSPLHRLNRAVAVAEHRGPQHALALLKGFTPPGWLAGSYLWAAVLADLHQRLGHTSEAIRYRDSAIELSPNDSIAALLRRRLSHSGDA